MSELSERVSKEPSFRLKAKIVWEHYLSRRIPDREPGVFTLEPNWIHAGYEVVKRFAEWDGVGKYPHEDEEHLVIEICQSHGLADGFSVPAFPGVPGGPQRIIHDGWKSGTPSWIFMGRALTPESVVHLGAGWVACQRTVPDELYKQMDQKAAPATLWMAYNVDTQMGLTALTSNVIGPAVSFNQLWDAVNAEAGPLYRTGANDKYV